MKKILNIILNFLYPPYCYLCDNRLSEGEEIICDDCWKNMEQGCAFVEGNDEFEFNKFHWMYIFNDKILELVHLLKYSGITKLSGHFIDQASNRIIKNDFYKDIDLIIPVPLHKVRLRERGYNQSKLIADELSRLLSIPVKTNLIRTKNNKSQTGLNRKERIKNVLNIFEVKEIEDLKEKNIILVDDILTTGATLNECTRVLKMSGAGNVNVLTVTFVEKLQNAV